MADDAAAPGKPRMSLGKKILIGVIAGIGVGVFLGDRSDPLNVVGQVYVNLLQMTVLPFVVISLVTKIGRLTVGQAKRLSGAAGLVMLGLWSVALLAVVAFPLSLPAWESGSFFSPRLVEPPATVDFLDLYIPTNPFNSLANNIVPAVVLFSILLGAALIGVARKDKVLVPLSALGESLGRISNWVIGLSPYGTFALAAGAAGTLSPGELFRISGYVSSFTLASIILTFVLLPGVTAVLTPYRGSRIVSRMGGALLTAFATGKLFAVLPMVTNSAREFLVEEGVPEEEAQQAADMFVPLGYPFPNAGKVLTLLFIAFAAWFLGEPFDAAEYPVLLAVGLLALFGSPLAAVVFLLGFFRLPGDMLTLFLVAGIWCARVGDVVGAMHLTCFTLLCDAWQRGTIGLRVGRLVPFFAVGGGVGVLFLVANHWIVAESLKVVPPTTDRVAAMEIRDPLVPIEEGEPGRDPAPIEAGETILAKVHRTGVLRVGYVPDNAPLGFRNGKGDLVGLEVDLVQRLAWDLGVKVQLVPYERDRLVDAFRAEGLDLAIGGIASQVRNWGRYQETRPYMEFHAAFVVEDSRVKEFRTVDSILRIHGLKIGYVKGGLMFRTGRHKSAGVKVVEIESPEAFFEGKRDDVDAVLVTAETGAVYTMIHPEFAVVIPEGVKVKVPMVFAIPKKGEFSELVDTWIGLKRADGTLDQLYDQWILGKDVKMAEPRWSVIRDVLGWVK